MRPLRLLLWLAPVLAVVGALIAGAAAAIGQLLFQSDVVF